MCIYLCWRSERMSGSCAIIIHYTWMKCNVIGLPTPFFPSIKTEMIWRNAFSPSSSFSHQKSSLCVCAVTVTLILEPKGLWFRAPVYKWRFVTRASVLNGIPLSALIKGTNLFPIRFLLFCAARVSVAHLLQPSSSDRSPSTYTHMQLITALNSNSLLLNCTVKLKQWKN